MSLENFLAQLKIRDIEFAENADMSRLTTFKIGGLADVLVTVGSVRELKDALQLAKENAVPVFILGRGSNLLISDNGIEGAVISLSRLDNIRFDGENVICEAGALLKRVCLEALEKNLSGLEFAYGIPGSMGGALYMNAGAYGGEMSQVVTKAKYLDLAGNEGEIALEDMNLGYRTSIFKSSDFIITEVTLSLKKAANADIKALMDDYMSRRRSKQPLEFPSAGSTFKRPEGYFAGALIEKSGLKGASVGGAQVSEKHAGFVINTGRATANDVLSLIKQIQDTVFENDGVKLETEVIFKGRN